MWNESSLLAAFLVGILGGAHCVGMCGGIVGALTFTLVPMVRNHLGTALPFLFAYNVGRITSYTFAGAIMGGLGLVAVNLIAFHQTERVLYLIAGLFMIALGLYLAGWWQGLTRIESAGSALLWRRLEPLGRKLLPVRTTTHAFVLGLIWGWLPCGLVYSVLVWSIASGGMIEGALLMLGFGLGTLPTLLLMGVFTSQLTGFFKHRWVRMMAGTVVGAFGVIAVGRAVFA